MTDHLTTDDADQTDPTIEELFKRLVSPTPYEFDDDDAMAIHDGQHHAITSPESYEAGFETLRALTKLEKAIEQHHAQWKDPLNAFRNAALALVASDLNDVQNGKRRLGKDLPIWKAEADRRDAEEKRRQEQEELAAARALQAASVAALAATAATETNPIVKASVEAQAAAVAAMPPPARPVTVAPTARKVRGTAIPKRWKPKVVDVRLLLRAWVDGKVHLDIEQALIDAITPKLAGVASSLGENIGKVYPGVTAELDQTAQAR